ncbi:MAG: hypothetical protein ABJ327_21600 [Litoreibacter sp.]
MSWRYLGQARLMGDIRADSRGTQDRVGLPKLEGVGGGVAFVYDLLGTTPGLGPAMPYQYPKPVDVKDPIVE